MDEGSGNIGKRLVDHRLGRFHGSGYACHQKRRSGKASDELEIDSIFHFLPLRVQKYGPKKYEDIEFLEKCQWTMYEKGGRKTGLEIITVFILERGGDQRSLKLRPAAPRSRLVTTAFKMVCRRIVTLCAFPPSSSSPHPPTLPSHSPTFPVTILLLPVLSFHYIVGFLLKSLRSFVYFISDLSVHRYTDLCDSFAVFFPQCPSHTNPLRLIKAL